MQRNTGTDSHRSVAPSRPLEVERLALTVEEAASLLGVSRGFAYQLVARGDLRSVRLGRRIVIPRAAVLRLLDPDVMSAR